MEEKNNNNQINPSVPENTHKEEKSTEGSFEIKAKRWLKKALTMFMEAMKVSVIIKSKDKNILFLCPLPIVIISALWVHWLGLIFLLIGFYKKWTLELKEIKEKTPPQKK